MNDIINLWLDTFDSPGTRSNYRRDILRFMDYLGDSKLTLKTLQAWRRTLRNDLPGLRALVAAVKSFTRFMYNQDYIHNSISKCLTIPKQKPTRIERNMSKRQVLLSMENAEPNTKLLLTLLFYLGGRVSEIVRLTKSDITTSDGRLIFTLSGKGNKTRIVPLNRRVSRYVNSQLRHYHRYLFPGRKGHITRQAAWKRVKKGCKWFLPQASCHWYRHAMATTAIQAGCDIGTVSKVLGHSSIATTSLYVHSKDKGASEYL